MRKLPGPKDQVSSSRSSSSRHSKIIAVVIFFLFGLRRSSERKPLLALLAREEPKAQRSWHIHLAVLSENAERSAPSPGREVK